MYCKHCGAENPNEAKFCRECGGELVPDRQCRNCKAKIGQNMKFCPDCGENLNSKQTSQQKIISPNSVETRTDKLVIIQRRNNYQNIIKKIAWCDWELFEIPIPVDRFYQMTLSFIEKENKTRKRKYAAHDRSSGKVFIRKVRESWKFDDDNDDYLLQSDNNGNATIEGEPKLLSVFLIKLFKYNGIEAEIIRKVF